MLHYLSCCCMALAYEQHVLVLAFFIIKIFLSLYCERHAIIRQENLNIEAKLGQAICVSWKCNIATRSGTESILLVPT